MGGEHSLKILAPQLLQFGINSVLKILNERMTYSMNEGINYKGVYRTAPATLGLLITGQDMFIRPEQARGCSTNTVVISSQKARPFLVGGPTASFWGRLWPLVKVFSGPKGQH